MLALAVVPVLMQANFSCTPLHTFAATAAAACVLPLLTHKASSHTNTSIFRRWTCCLLAEAEELRKQYGPNELPEKTKSSWMIWLDQFKAPTPIMIGCAPTASANCQCSCTFVAGRHAKA